MFRRIRLLWNWNGAFLSAVLRGSLFLILNLPAGPTDAVTAMLTQSMIRFLTGGLSAGLIEYLCEVEPPWLASGLASVILPLLVHAAEFAIHTRGVTPKVFLGVALSILFTGFSTAFQFFAMRRGVLIAGSKRPSVIEDLKALPRLVMEFMWTITRPLFDSAGL